MKRPTFYDVQVSTSFQVYGLRISYNDMGRVYGRTKTELKRNIRLFRAAQHAKFLADATHLKDTFFD